MGLSKLGAGAAVVLAAAGALSTALEHPSPSAKHAGGTIRITIPAGTAARLAAGQRTSGVPTRIVARVGDTLRLLNSDRSEHMIGPFYVGPRQEMTVPLERAGVYSTTCALQPNHRTEIVVR